MKAVLDTELTPFCSRNSLALSSLSSKTKSLPDFAALEGFLTPDGIAFSGQLRLLAYNNGNYFVFDSLHKTPTTTFYLNNNRLYVS